MCDPSSANPRTSLREMMIVFILYTHRSGKMLNRRCCRLKTNGQVQKTRGEMRSLTPKPGTKTVSMGDLSSNKHRLEHSVSLSILGSGLRQIPCGNWAFSKECNHYSQPMSTKWKVPSNSIADFNAETYCRHTSDDPQRPLTPSSFKTTQTPSDTTNGFTLGCGTVSHTRMLDCR